MMKFKKFLAAAMTGAMMFGMVATAAPAVSTYAGTSVKSETPETMVFQTAKRDAETVTKAGISYEKMTLTIKSNDPFVIVKYYKDATKEKETNTYTYPTKKGSVTIDLGFYKPGNKKAKVVWYGSTAPNTVLGMEELSEATDKLKIKVDKTADNTKDALKLDTLVGYSYRSLYASDWQNLDAFDYSTARVAGTTIVVRKDATPNTPASAETKVKISGMTKAPTLKITYEKDVIKVKNMDVALMDEFVAKGEEAYNPMTKDCTFAELAKELKVTDLSKPLNIIVRTNKSGKVSMPSICTLTPPPVLQVSGDKATAFTQVTTTGSSITTSGSSITVSGSEKKGKTEVTFDVKHTSNNKDTYEYSIDNKKWKAVTDKKVTVSQATIWVRVAGVKAPKSDSAPDAAFPSDGKELTIPKQANPENGDNK